MSVFIKARARRPEGSRGLDDVRINVEEIAAYRGHVRPGETNVHSYDEWVLVTLRCGEKFDLRLTMEEFESRFFEATSAVRR